MLTFGNFLNNDTVNLEEKIGQMLLVGFYESEVNENSEIIKYIRKYNLGGVIYFDYHNFSNKKRRNIKNPSQLKMLSQTLQEFAPTKLFISSDVEGGYVNRLKKKYGFDAEIPSYLKMGQRNDLQKTHLDALKLAIILKNIGVNTNFAPVLDLDMNSPIISKYERSFSSNPEKVYRHAAEVIKAHNENNIISVGKHFPGHGSSSGDTHHELVDITSSWAEEELIPFEKAINHKLLDSVMVAHLLNKNIDSKYPASLSYNFITKILRDKMQYKGVIISDDLDMRALQDNFTLEQILIQFINAGGDILLFGNNHNKDLTMIDNVVSLIIKNVKAGIIPLDRINESYKRITRLKEKYIFD